MRQAFGKLGSRKGGERWYGWVRGPHGGHWMARGGRTLIPSAPDCFPAFILALHLKKIRSGGEDYLIGPLRVVDQT